MTLELKLGTIETLPKSDMPFGAWKGIVSKEGNTLLFHAAVQPGGLFSKDVVEKFNISDVLGGVDVLYSFGRLTIHGMSADYGIVPNQVMEEFSKLIIPAFEKQFPVEHVRLDMHYNPESSPYSSSKNIRRWNELGYQFDNKARELK